MYSRLVHSIFFFVIINCKYLKVTYDKFSCLFFPSEQCFLLYVFNKIRSAPMFCNKKI